MKKEFYKGFWALPGGLVKPDESLEEAAKRHLLAKSRVRDIYLEQSKSKFLIGPQNFTDLKSRNFK